MSKRHTVAYVKPKEPSFLRKLKEQIGYREGPTVDTKREDLGDVAEEDLRDTAEEQPTVVVVKPGDLTADEATREEERLRKEADEKPADLSQRIVFKSRKPKTSEAGESSENSKKRPSDSKDSKAKKAKNKTKKTLLSFDDEEGEEA